MSVLHLRCFSLFCPSCIVAHRIKPSVQDEKFVITSGTNLGLAYTFTVYKTLFRDELWVGNFLLYTNQAISINYNWGWPILQHFSSYRCCSYIFSTSDLCFCGCKTEEPRPTEGQKDVKHIRCTLSIAAGAAPHFVSPSIQCVLYDEASCHDRLHILYGACSQFPNRVHDVDDYLLDGVRTQCKAIWGPCPEHAWGQQRAVLQLNFAAVLYIYRASLGCGGKDRNWIRVYRSAADLARHQYWRSNERHL